jgi:hypothetical protein
MEWRPVKGFEDLYQINNIGHVMNRHHRLLTPRMNNAGYMRVGLYKNNKSHYLFVHRLVAQTFVEQEESKVFVNHKDGNKLNNSADNLEWVTPSENNIHAVKTGLSDACHSPESRR